MIDFLVLVQNWLQSGLYGWQLFNVPAYSVPQPGMPDSADNHVLWAPPCVQHQGIYCGKIQVGNKLF